VQKEHVRTSKDITAMQMRHMLLVAEKKQNIPVQHPAFLDLSCACDISPQPDSSKAVWTWSVRSAEATHRARFSRILCKMRESVGVVPFTQCIITRATFLACSLNACTEQRLDINQLELDTVCLYFSQRTCPETPEAHVLVRMS
jgi:hypothetical protein